MVNKLGGDFSPFEKDPKTLAKEIAQKKPNGHAEAGEWGKPDMELMRLHRRTPGILVQWGSGCVYGKGY